MPCHIWALRYAIFGHIWAPSFQLTALHAPALSGHRVCNPLPDFTRDCTHIRPEAGRGAEHGDRCAVPRGACACACVRGVRRARISDYYPRHGPIYTRE